MTLDQIQRLRDLAARATPGPWRATCDTWVVHGEFDDMVAEADEFNDAEYLAALSPEVLVGLLDLAQECLEHREAEQIRQRWREELGDPWEGRSALAHAEGLLAMAGATKIPEELRPLLEQATKAAEEARRRPLSDDEMRKWAMRLAQDSVNAGEAEYGG